MALPVKATVLNGNDAFGVYEGCMTATTAVVFALCRIEQISLAEDVAKG